MPKKQESRDSRTRTHTKTDSAEIVSNLPQPEADSLDVTSLPLKPSQSLHNTTTGRCEKKRSQARRNKASSSIVRKRKTLARKDKGGNSKKAPSIQMRSVAAKRMDNDVDSDQYEDEYDDSSDVMPTADDDERLSPGSRSWAYYGGGERESMTAGSNDRKRKFQPPSPPNHYGTSHVRDSTVRNSKTAYHHPISRKSVSASVVKEHHHYHQNQPSQEEEEKHLEVTTTAAPPEGPTGWTEEMHRQLVEAIYDIGVSHASPSVIMEHMNFLSATEALDGSVDGAASASRVASTQVTSERVKSHLQKYRKNKKKSRDEFCREYDRWMHKAVAVVGGISAAARTSLATTPSAVVGMIGETPGHDTKSSTCSKEDTTKILLGGDFAAFLTYSVMLEEEHAKLRKQEEVGPTDPNLFQSLSSASEPPVASLMMLRNGGDLSSQPHSFLPSAMEYTQGLSGARIPLPVLTEEERQSSLGVSISHVVGLFYSMTHNLMKERKKNEQHPSNIADTAEGNTQEVSGVYKQQASSADASTADASTASAVVAPPPIPTQGSGIRAFFAQPEGSANDSRRQVQHVQDTASSYRQMAHASRYQPVHQNQRYSLAENNNQKGKANAYFDPPQRNGPSAARPYSGP